MTVSLASERLFPIALGFLTLLAITEGYVITPLQRSLHHPTATLFTLYPSSSKRSPSLISLAMQSEATTVLPPSWTDLTTQIGATAVGRALNDDRQLRQQGRGAAHVQNTLRLFDSFTAEPKITVYRDHAGWCPYCQKTMLLIEEKKVPVKIELINMRSYGEKPREFLQKVPGGLLPAMEVDGKVITESQVIMELLDEWHPPEQGYRRMLPDQGDAGGWAQLQTLARLERELFSLWCNLLFRPEGPRLGGPGNPLTQILGGGAQTEMSGAMQAFVDCMRKVDRYLLATPGPFFEGHDYPTMIDFIYVSHVERQLASCAFWKGLNLRDPQWNLRGLNAWLDAFEKRETYLAFKSDYYTHVKDIPPQYGPSWNGGFEADREKFSASILGLDGSWQLPLTHDDDLQPLYRGIPLPSCVLEAAGIASDPDGSHISCDGKAMASACRLMAAWKLAGNGENVARFASRGGPQGSQNPRKSFGAELADPYANPDEDMKPYTDTALRIVCAALMDVEASTQLPDQQYADMLRASVPSNQVGGVISCLAYLRDRVGVPRDLPLAAARYLRAYLNWGIAVLSPS